MSTPVSTLPHPRAARLAAKLSYRRLAELAHVAAVTVWRCEVRGSYPRIPNVRRAYLLALGLPEDA